MTCITLTTDFGLQDGYVGMMKGVVLSTCPAAVIVDITHSIPPQDIVAAGRLLKAAYPYFPDGTVHVAVVDPGVGGNRAILAAQVGVHRFLVPDNGLLPLIVSPEYVNALHRVENPAVCLPAVSNTFHGRDIFAPAAGHLAGGMPISQVGPELAPAKPAPPPDLPAVRFDPTGITGRVVAVDHFGNLITDISRRDLAHFFGNQAREGLTTTLNQRHIYGLCRSYSAVPSGTPLALISSRDTVEIAVNQGSAAALFQAGRGDEVRVSRPSAGSRQPHRHGVENENQKRDASARTPSGRSATSDQRR